MWHDEVSHLTCWKKQSGGGEQHWKRKKKKREEKREEEKKCERLQLLSRISGDRTIGFR